MTQYRKLYKIKARQQSKAADIKAEQKIKKDF